MDDHFSCGKKESTGFIISKDCTEEWNRSDRFLSFFHVFLLCILAVAKRNKLSMKKSNNFTQLHQQIMLFSGRNCCREEERQWKGNSNQCLQQEFTVWKWSAWVETMTTTTFFAEEGYRHKRPLLFVGCLFLSLSFFTQRGLEEKEPLFLHLRKTWRDLCSGWERNDPSNDCRSVSDVWLRIWEACLSLFFHSLFSLSSSLCGEDSNPPASTTHDSHFLWYMARICTVHDLFVCAAVVFAQSANTLIHENPDDGEREKDRVDEEDVHTCCCCRCW